jgi:ABC-2 type transport system ATP-binding protein
MECIVVEDLKKYYGQVKAVDGLSFSVSQGEIFGMLGPNGAGKTTTVECLIGLLDRDSGRVEVLGYDPRTNPREVKSRIGVQLQTAAMFPRLTVTEIVKLYASFYPNPISADQAISLVGLEEKARTQTKNLSGGQLQRLSVAIALVANGDIVFLDEPTTGMDPQARRALWQVVEGMRKQGKTVFLTTHYMDEAEKLCDRVAVVDRGKVIALDSPANLIHDNFSEQAIEFAHSQLAGDESLSSLPGVVRKQVENNTVILYTSEVARTMGALLTHAQETGVDVGDLTVRTATLEDVFLKLTGRRIRE